MAVRHRERFSIAARPAFGRDVRRRTARDARSPVGAGYRSRAAHLPIVRQRAAAGRVLSRGRDGSTRDPRVRAQCVAADSPRSAAGGGAAPFAGVRYSERILARDVAKTLGVSESRLNRCFRLAFGSTMHRYLLKLRVRYGLDLIAQGMKIEAAALSVGFRSKKDFYHAVQQLVGCTPAQFRSRRIRP
ncbi:MAG: hypothetical protein DMF86_14585 [Acidobacteria bacterium]|nr:MAG: hypothetical protein DMF86_14585 [Acidobacteriota bacterium]